MHVPRRIAISGAIAGVLAAAGAAYVYVTTRGSGTRTFRFDRPSPIRLTAASVGAGFSTESKGAAAVPSSGTNDDAAAAKPVRTSRRSAHPAGSARAVLPVVVHETVDARCDSVVHASLQPSASVSGVAQDAHSSTAVTLMLSSN